MGDQPVDPATPNVLRIRTIGEPADYAFSVSGDLAPGPAFDDGIDGSSASGSVAGTGSDDFSFSGEITEFDRTGALHVFVDGEEVDPDSLGSPPRTLTIAGSGPQVEYELTVGGALEKSEANGASINPDDTVWGSTATGFVYDGTDSYAFDGEIEYLAVDPESLTLPNVITVSNRPYDEPDSCAVTVSGTIAPTRSVNVGNGDRVDGTTASGRVYGGSDAYRFSGKVTDFQYSGPVRVTVNGKETYAADR